MDNRNKIILFFIIIIIILLNFLGCIKKENNFESQKKISNVIINAPDQAYFEDNIEFEAFSNEFKIQSYNWDFQDGNSINGKKVNHKFSLDNIYNIEFPLIYTITLFSK